MKTILLILCPFLLMAQTDTTRWRDSVKANRDSAAKYFEIGSYYEDVHSDKKNEAYEKWNAFKLRVDYFQNKIDTFNLIIANRKRKEELETKYKIKL
jgi:hypothetical protein